MGPTTVISSASVESEIGLNDPSCFTPWLSRPLDNHMLEMIIGTDDGVLAKARGTLHSLQNQCS